MLFQRVSKEELQKILEKHQRWLESDKQAGDRGCLKGANLQWAFLKNANLQEAYLGDAHLQKANLEHVNLKKAKFQRADLRGANLEKADLRMVLLANIPSILKLLTFSHKSVTFSSMMKKFLRLLFIICFGSEKTSDLALENLAFRQQVAALKRSIKRPQLRCRDRLFWILLSRFWSNWREALIIVKPDTVVRWHKKGFKIFWKFKSRRKGLGRPRVNPEIHDLIRRMAQANPLWGAPRIHGELLKLGIEISERTVSNLMPRRKPRPPSQTWRTFLKNHMINMVSIDFFTVPTGLPPFCGPLEELESG